MATLSVVTESLDFTSASMSGMNLACASAWMASDGEVLHPSPGPPRLVLAMLGGACRGQERPEEQCVVVLVVAEHVRAVGRLQRDALTVALAADRVIAERLRAVGVHRALSGRAVGAAVVAARLRHGVVRADVEN